MKKLLLHICCAPDAIVPYERENEFEIHGYFYNPCIHPLDEFQRRADTCALLEKEYGAVIDIDERGFGLWDRAVRGMEDQPEKSNRCRICIALRLERTAAKAAHEGYSAFTTSLSTSPHKDFTFIQNTAIALSGKYSIPFHAADYKKRDGFLLSVKRSRALGMYRQNYCGCRYSMSARAVA